MFGPTLYYTVHCNVCNAAFFRAMHPGIYLVYRAVEAMIGKSFNYSFESR